MGAHRYDDWKLRSDRDDGPDDECEEPPAEEPIWKNFPLPPDGYGPGYFEHALREDFANLRRFVGFETAREIVAEIINEAAKGDF